LSAQEGLLCTAFARAVVGDHSSQDLPVAD
jgi:hypothetical protein